LKYKLDSKGLNIISFNNIGMNWYYRISKKRRRKKKRNPSVSNLPAPYVFDDKSGLMYKTPGGLSLAEETAKRDDK